MGGRLSEDFFLDKDSLNVIVVEKISSDHKFSVYAKNILIFADIQAKGPITLFAKEHVFYYGLVFSESFKSITSLAGPIFYGPMDSQIIEKINTLGIKISESNRGIEGVRFERVEVQSSSHRVQLTVPSNIPKGPENVITIAEEYPGIVQAGNESSPTDRSNSTKVYEKFGLNSLPRNNNQNSTDPSYGEDELPHKLNANQKLTNLRIAQHYPGGKIQNDRSTDQRRKNPVNSLLPQAPNI